MDSMVHLKRRNNKIFSNLDIDHRETLKFTETESTLWTEAQVLNTKRAAQHVEALNLPSISGSWCFTHGSWKYNELFSVQDWYSIL